MWKAEDGWTGAWALEKLMSAIESEGKLPKWALVNTNGNGVRKIPREKVMGETKKKIENTSVPGKAMGAGKAERLDCRQ